MYIKLYIFFYFKLSTKMIKMITCDLHILISNHID